MEFKNYSFSKLPFSRLFGKYVTDFKQVADFYETNPFDTAAVSNFASRLKFDGRGGAPELLLQFNLPFGINEAAIDNINRLKSDDALALVTGQQLGVFGGPLYTFYKILTTIQLSRSLEKQLDRPVIPVFWLADEDHDYDEVRSVQIINRGEVQTCSLPQNHSGLPVSNIKFADDLDELKKQLKNSLIDTDFSVDLWALLDECFKSGESFLMGFGTFISRLFSKYGLVLAGSNHTEIKARTKTCLIESVKKADAGYKALDKQSKKLESAYHQQVTLYNSHLFYTSDSNGRIKIERRNDSWETETGRQWTSQELIDEIEQHPEKFSPDVFLRPVLQDMLLPTLGYIAGPGEIAYYGQMKSFYGVFGMSMPVIFPRLSATLVEPAISRIFRELPFEINDYGMRIEDLESAYARQSQQLNIERLFEEWKEGIDDLTIFNTKSIQKIDESLDGAARKAQAHYLNELDKLKGKTYNAIKKNDRIQIKRIHRIQRNLFPGRNLQERAISGIYYMNKFGVDIWDRVLESLNDEISLRQHKLIYL